VYKSKKKAMRHGSVDPLNRQPDVPNRPHQLAPNMIAKPNAKNVADEMQKSMKFLIATLMLFLARTSPVSKQQKPACISITRKPQLKTQITSLILWFSVTE